MMRAISSFSKAPGCTFFFAGLLAMMCLGSGWNGFRLMTQGSRLLHDGVYAEAKVLDTKKGQRGFMVFHYAFEHDGRTIEGWSPPGAANVSPGDIVKVLYLPSDPTISSYSADRDFREGRVDLVTSIVFIAFGLYLTFLWRRQRTVQTARSARIG
jgi:hypothetical protein